MTAVGILWVVLSPYGTGLFVAWSRFANRIVTRFLPVFAALGWSALVTLFVGVFAVGDGTGMQMAMASAPFAGLAVWKPGPGRGGDGRSPVPDGVPPAPDAIATRGRRLPAPARRRPTGHQAGQGSRVPLR